MREPGAPRASRPTMLLMLLPQPSPCSLCVYCVCVCVRVCVTPEDIAAARSPRGRQGADSAAARDSKSVFQTLDVKRIRANAFDLSGFRRGEQLAVTDSRFPKFFRPRTAPRLCVIMPRLHFPPCLRSSNHGGVESTRGDF